MLTNIKVKVFAVFKGLLMTKEHGCFDNWRLLFYNSLFMFFLIVERGSYCSARKAL
jgi:hypothetical protein